MRRRYSQREYGHFEGGPPQAEAKIVPGWYFGAGRRPAEGSSTVLQQRSARLESFVTIQLIPILYSNQYIRFFSEFQVARSAGSRFFSIEARDHGERSTVHCERSQAPVPYMDLPRYEHATLTAETGRNSNFPAAAFRSGRNKVFGTTRLAPELIRTAPNTGTPLL